MIPSTCGTVAKQFKNVSLSSYHMLCTTSNNKLFSKSFFLASIQQNSSHQSGWQYSNNIHYGKLSFSHFGFKQQLLTARVIGKNHIGTRNIISGTPLVASKESKFGAFFKRLFKKNKFGDVHLYRTGYSLYSDISMNTDVLHFFKVLSLEDTLFSWFLVMELQVWLVSVRLGAEGEDGKLVRDNLITAFWQDVEAKIKVLGERPTNKSEQIDELNSHFQTSLIGYDEGLQSCDRTLACAVWRNIIRRERNNPYYARNLEEPSDESIRPPSQSSGDDSKINLDDVIVKPEVDPRSLEAVVCYIRKQVHLFDQVPSEDFLVKGKGNWTKLEAIS